MRVVNVFDQPNDIRDSIFIHFRNGLSSQQKTSRKKKIKRNEKQQKIVIQPYLFLVKALTTTSTNS